MRCASAATLSVVDLRSRRTRLPLLWLIKWDEPHRLCDTFPVAETLKRFFIPLWVFNFGMAAAFLFDTIATIVIRCVSDGGNHRGFVVIDPGQDERSADPSRALAPGRAP